MDLAKKEYMNIKVQDSDDEKNHYRGGRRLENRGRRTISLYDLQNIKPGLRKWNFLMIISIALSKSSFGYSYCFIFSSIIIFNTAQL